jgi:hypothetical protein
MQIDLSDGLVEAYSNSNEGKMLKLSAEASTYPL